MCAIRELVRQAGSDSNPRILCGDFNSTVTSAGYQLATEGYFNDDVLKQLQALENLNMPDGTVIYKYPPFLYSDVIDNIKKKLRKFLTMLISQYIC